MPWWFSTYATVGKPLAICQTTFGAQMTSINTTPIQGYFVRSSSRSDGVSKTAEPIPAMSARMRNLISRPTPSEIPSRIQVRGFRSMMIERNQYSETIQATWSKITVWKRKVPRMNGSVTPISRASAWSRSDPPSLRTYAPQRMTLTPPSSAGSTRSAHGETPSSVVSTRLRSGTIGGKSTYPNAGCRPLAM